MPQRKLVLFTDIGDTIIDEGTEIHSPDGTVVSASTIPGAKEAYLRLYEEGFPIVMVADGLTRSFSNTMKQNGLDHIFSARIISEEIGEDKPSAKMFSAALEALGLTDADKPRVLMIGNNIARDILGANRFGIRSVLLTWSKRRSFEPTVPDEIPTCRIASPDELPPLVLKLELEF